MSARKSSHCTIFLIVSSGSPLALIASSLRSISKKPFCPMTRSLHPPMTACGHRVRFAGTWREEFFEVPITKIDQQGWKSERFSRFLGEMVSFSDSELKTAGYIRALTEWLFDLLRNILMVGFLFYLAKRTNNSILHVAAGVANAMLLVYLLSYLNTWSIHPYQTYYRLRTSSVVDVIIMMIVVGLITLIIYIGIPHVAKQIASGYENQKADLVSPTNDSFLE